MTVTTTDHWIDIPNGRLFARSWNLSGPPDRQRSPFLLFHDSLGCVALWRDFPAQLAVATERRVIAYDRLGFGRSDPYPGSLPLTFVHDEGSLVVPQLVEALDVERMVPFGHSVGGGMALATAARLPATCAAVVTEAAQTFVESRTVAGLRDAKADFARPGQLERLARYHGAKARWVLDAWIETWLSPAFADWSLDSELRGVRCPTLALHGDVDEYGSVEHPARIARLVQGASHAVILEGCGHIPHREQTADVLDEVVAFLGEQRAA